MTTELRRLRNYIDGEFRDAADGRTTDVVNPATGEAYATAPLSGQADVDAAMAAAEAAFPAWRDTTPAERQKALLKIADAFEERAEELIAAEVENTGKPIGLTRTEEIPPMVDQIRFFAGAARMLEGRSAGEYMDGMTSIVRREPVGVCAQVAPWNYPMMMAVWKFAPAIAAGNTVVLKPSDTTPASTVLIAEIIGSILPKGVFNVICGDRDTGRTGRSAYAGGVPGATAPVGTKVSFSGNDILRVRDGRFVEYWTCTDVLDGLSQLGAISGPNGPAPGR
ncbi:Gamma-aminobutyraldehyde dehydrogenase [Streptomyces glaucescens]